MSWHSHEEVVLRSFPPRNGEVRQGNKKGNFGDKATGNARLKGVFYDPGFPFSSGKRTMAPAIVSFSLETYKGDIINGGHKKQKRRINKKGNFFGRLIR